MSQTVELGVTFKPLTCSECSTTFALNKRHYDKRREDHGTFYCPSCGVTQHFPGESKMEAAERLRRHAEDSLARERAQHDQTKAARAATERRLIATKGVVTRTKRRVGRGVCPCCNRYFAELHAHMHIEHPEYHRETE